MAKTLAGRATGGPSQRGTGRSISEREDLANFISMITRDETPFLSSIGKTKSTAIFHEWQTDELTAPGNSRVAEGWDFSTPIAIGTDNVTPAANSDSDAADAATTAGPNRTRLGNYTQINGKTMAVSGTRRSIDQAGVADEYAYQLKKRGTELRRDVEHDLLMTANTSGYTQGNALTEANGNARTAGAVNSWINDDATVEFAGTPASDITDAQKGVGTHVRGLATTAANRGALTLSDIDLTMQKIYQEGGKASRIMVSPKLRRDFSDLMVTDSGVRRNIDTDGKLRQSVDVYMSDFGDLMVVPNYIQGLGSDTLTATNYKDAAAYIYDPQWFAIATLRPLQEVDVGQKGDSTIGMMVEEWTLEVKNPIGCGALYNLK